MSCRKALLKLCKKGIIKLPASSQPEALLGENRYKSVEAVEFSQVSCDLSKLGRIEIIKVENRYRDESRIWNYMMQEYHYLGAGPLCGAQLRYLVKSSIYGWIGGLSFSASAWRVNARDDLIGWTDAARENNLSKVVCNSRFLIIPQVKVPNLASWILSHCSKKLSKDWKARYNYEPVLLETFVDSHRFEGICYRASNWILAGKTKGRGRQDKFNKRAVTQKYIYLYPLHNDWQSILSQLPADYMANKVEKSKRKEPEDWAEEEFGEADLGDIRLEKRLLNITRDFYARPGADIPQASGTRAKAKGVYRFLDNKQTDMNKLLEPHYGATVERIKEHNIVLAVQDTTTLNYTAHHATQGLGPINTKKDNGIGLIVHDTMAFTEEGTPLGLVDVQCWVRDPEDAGRKERRHNEPMENKESNKWLISYQKTRDIQKNCPNTLLVSVGDRESDIHELFEEALREPESANLLVRAERTRQRRVEQESLWEKMEGESVAGIQEVYIPRRGSIPARTAKLEVRFAKVTLNPPKKKKGLKTITVWAVFSREIDYGDEVKSPLEWMLLTTMEVTTFEQATEKLTWYTRRWGIEVYHRTFKSGCKIEARRLGNVDRIETCLAIDMVVAWRIYYLTKLGRETPRLPCTVYFDDDEWKALVAFKTKNPVPPENPPELREAIHMVASLGGFLGRKGDGEPGTTTLWRGLQRLDDITETWRVFMAWFSDRLALVSGKMDYG